MRFLRIQFSFVLLLFPLFLTSHGYAQENASLSIITPHTESIRQEIGLKFSNWYQEHFKESIKLDWRNVGGSSDTIRFIRSEFTAKPEGIGLDILFGCGVDPYFDLKNEKFLERCSLPEEILSSIPADNQGTLLRDPDGFWYGVTIATFGILHNLRVQGYNHLPQAKKWKDLALPELHDWVAISDPRNSGSMYTMMEVILQGYGWEEGWRILTGMAANSTSIGRYATDAPRLTTLGNTASGICIDFYGFTQVNAHGKTNMIFTIPEDFSILSPDCIAILKGTEHLKEAQRFIEFVLSDEGQKLWMFPIGSPEGPVRSALLRMPIRKDLYTRYPQYSPVQNSPFYNESKVINGNTNNTFTLNNELAYKRRDLVCALIGAQLIDTHPELRKAWAEAIRKGKAEKTLILLSKPLITENELQALLQNEWKDPLQKNRIKIRWQIEAQTRCQTIRKELRQQP